MRIHEKTLGDQLYAHCCFMPRGSDEILLNCMYFQPNMSSIPKLRSQLVPLIVFPFGIELQGLTTSRDINAFRRTLRKVRFLCNFLVVMGYVLNTTNTDPMQ